MPDDTSPRPREKWAATARTALLFALPLVFVALIGALWLDADYIMLRDEARRESAHVAEAIGAAATIELRAVVSRALGEVESAAANGLSPPSQLWRVVYGYDLGLLILIRHGETVMFPPEDPLAAPKMWEEKVRALNDVADLLSAGDFVSGWFPNIAGEFYFECRRKTVKGERDETCISLSDSHVFPLLTKVLDQFALAAADRAMRLRDPFGRIVWSHGQANGPIESFLMSDALQGWSCEIIGSPKPKRGAMGRVALALPLAAVWLLLVLQARRAQNARLAASAARAALAARLSHDLRTPLANLKLYAELIARKADAPDIIRYCGVLSEEIDRLDALAGETIFQGRPGGAAGNRTVADPGALARRAAARLDNLLAASGSTCSVTCDIGGELRFDVSAFERILVNLIDNARKYAPGSIEVAIGWRDGLLSLSVRDHGGGAGGAAPPKSHGLGLSIVQELAGANGGAFSLSGANPGLCARATLAAELV